MNLVTDAQVWVNEAEKRRQTKVIGDAQEKLTGRIRDTQVELAQMVLDDQIESGHVQLLDLLFRLQAVIG